VDCEYTQRTAAIITALPQAVQRAYTYGRRVVKGGGLHEGLHFLFISRQGQHQRDVYRVLAMSYFYHRLN
jgi:hypothetical protein